MWKMLLHLHVNQNPMMMRGEKIQIPLKVDHHRRLGSFVIFQGILAIIAN